MLQLVQRRNTALPFVLSLLRGKTTSKSLKRRAQKKPAATEPEAFNGLMLNLLGKTESTDVDKEIESRVRPLEMMIQVKQKQHEDVGDNLRYLLDNYGAVSSTLTESQKKLMRRLIGSNLARIQSLVKQTTNVEDLMIILGHLEFRGLLDMNTLASILLRLDLEHLMAVHQHLSAHPEKVQNWYLDPAIQMKTEIAIASRYKMLGSHIMAQYIISNCLEKSWLPKISAGVFRSAAYMRNMVLLLNGEVPEWKLAEQVIETNDAQLAYSFWEIHPRNADVREYCADNEAMTGSQQLVIEFANNAIFLESGPLTNRLAKLSRGLGIGLKDSAKQHQRLTCSLEVLLRETESENTEALNELSSLLEEEAVDVGVIEHGYR